MFISILIELLNKSKRIDGVSKNCFSAKSSKHPRAKLPLKSTATIAGIKRNRRLSLDEGQGDASKGIIISDDDIPKIKKTRGSANPEKIQKTLMPIRNLPMPLSNCLRNSYSQLLAKTVKPFS